MGDPNFGVEDFDFNFRVSDDEQAAVVTHFVVDDAIEGNGYGSVIIEVIKRIAFETHNVEVLEISMGGGDRAKSFLESNGFEVFNVREYSEKAKESLGSEYGVDARYRQEWVKEDYSRDWC